MKIYGYLFGLAQKTKPHTVVFSQVGEDQDIDIIVCGRCMCSYFLVSINLDRCFNQIVFFTCFSGEGFN